MGAPLDLQNRRAELEGCLMKTGTSVGIACAVGVAGGIVIGSHAVKIYDWRTE